MSPDNYDVIIIGGGPAGSSCAGLLAQRGRKVLLLEKEKFPRYHIGESLITGVWPTLEQLGLREAMDSTGWIRKYGANVLWGAEDEYWGFRFADTGRWDYTYQVPRAQFDQLLLEQARTLGAAVIEEATVKQVVFETDRATGVEYQLKGHDEPMSATASFIIDASGQSRLIGRERNLVEWHEDLRNIAHWQYFQGCVRPEGERGGYTVIENMLGGWFWFIPMANDVTSVGYVTATEILKASGMSIEELFEDRLRNSQKLSELVAPARRVSGYHSARDWSYECTTMYGNGWAIIGDAAAFVDPLLSTGVALAVRAARIASQAVDFALDHPDQEAEVLARFEANCREYLNVILAFVRYFYDTSRTRYQYYQGAQELIDENMEEEPAFDFVQLVSGLARDQDLELPPVKGQAGA